MSIASIRQWEVVETVAKWRVLGKIYSCASNNIHQQTFVPQATAYYFRFKETQRSAEHGWQVDGKWSQISWVEQILDKERWKRQVKPECHMDKLLGKEGETTSNGHWSLNYFVWDTERSFFYFWKREMEKSTPGLPKSALKSTTLTPLPPWVGFLWGKQESKYGIWCDIMWCPQELWIFQKSNGRVLGLPNLWDWLRSKPIITTSPRCIAT